MHSNFASEFRRLGDLLRKYDSIDLAAGIGALQLMPANADRLVRLKAAANLIASIPAEPGSPSMSLPHWRQWLNAAPLGTPPLVDEEDPFENLFTEELTYYGGSYRVFPDFCGDDAFILRHQLAAIFLNAAPFSNTEFGSAAQSLCASALLLSDTIARRSELRRGQLPFTGNSRGVVVPPKVDFARLKAAVTFRQDDLIRLVSRLGGRIEDIDRLSRQPGTFALDPDHVVERPTLTHPILRFGDTYVVVNPQSLLTAIRHALLCLAIEHGVQSELADRFRQVVSYTVERSLETLGLSTVVPSQPHYGDPTLVETFLAVDNDKLAHVLVVTDDLDRYSSDNPIGPWIVLDLPHVVASRVATVREEVYARLPDVNDILHITVVQTIGRPIPLALDHRVLTGEFHQLAISASDLECIAAIEGAQPLSLWQYVLARERALQNTEFIQFNEFDAFALFHRRGCSFYDASKPRPGLITILPGMGRTLRFDVQRRLDLHAAPSLEPNSAIEVRSVYGDSTIPIYVPAWPRSGQVAVLAEIPPINVWIVGPERLIDERYRDLYFVFADALAYWLWQCSPSLTPLSKALAGLLGCICIELDLLPDEHWFDLKSELPANLVEWLHLSDKGAGRLHLTISAAIMDRLHTPDNGAERAMLRVVLHGLRDLSLHFTETDTTNVSDAMIDEWVDRHAPLGLKKKFVLVTVLEDVRLDDHGLPPYRPVQHADLREIQEELAAHLASKGHKPGPIAIDQQTTVLDSIVVKFYFHQLERLVSTIHSDGLSEELIARYEAVISERARTQVAIPARMACFQTKPPMIEELHQQIVELNEAALAARFIIEYVAARPPRGLRPLSLSVYDRLQAIASEVINHGITSDLIYYCKAKVALSILPSGILDTDRGAFGEVFIRFQAAFVDRQVEESDRDYASLWRSATWRPTEHGLERFDEASRVEFGITLNDLVDFLARAIFLGHEQGSEPSKMPMRQFRKEMVHYLGWSTNQLDRAIELFVSWPRSEFLKPPAPLKSPEVYPWRFNRDLSYLRKPLIARRRPDGDEIIWGTRHVYETMLYLIDLCESGRLKARSYEMKHFMGDLRQQESEQFNDRVAEYFESLSGLIVKRRVDKIAGQRIEEIRGQALGDVDVLVADPRHRRLLAIETKDLAVARTPVELANELNETFRSSDRRPSAVEKHLKRVEWLRAHVCMILSWLGLSAGDERRWKVDAWVVLDRDLVGRSLTDRRIKVACFDELQDAFSVLSKEEK